MRILIVYAHPALDSYLSSVLGELTTQLEANGHELRILDLYEKGFDPVLRLDAWRAHRSGKPSHGELDGHIEALREADGLMFVFPTWWYGLPAILKGWLDRVFQPLVAFAVEDGEFKLHYLPRLKHFAAVTTCGSPQPLIEWVAGDPVRRQLMRGLKLQFAHTVRTCWTPIYNIDARSPTELAHERERAAAAAAKFFGKG
jgi:putative NADPH-quinone reductase